MKLILPSLLKAETAGKEIKILTSDYMKITEPSALYRMKSLKNIRMFNNINNISYPPKAYIFQYSDGTGEAIIGSSNISYSALKTGVE